MKHTITHTMDNKTKLLAVLVNYGDEQLQFLREVVSGLKTFNKYEVTVIVNSNLPLEIEGIDEVNVITLPNYQFLPLTCRRVLWENRDKYDVFIYGENDHLFTETHLDRHLEYAEILPENRISGLIQYEENELGKFYPGYHADFEWDFSSLEVHGDKKFAHFTNVHQATFIVTRAQLLRAGQKFDFTELVNDFNPSRLKRAIDKIKKKLHLPVTKRNAKYSVKCKVNTDIYEYGGMKKMICITDFEDNLIHHLPNLYIEGLKGRYRLRSDENRMSESLSKFQ